MLPFVELCRFLLHFLSMPHVGMVFHTLHSLLLLVEGSLQVFLMLY
jgi:hypothetical protein